MIGLLRAMLLALLLSVIPPAIMSVAAQCTKPPGWVPGNLAELLRQHQAWATETLPPDPDDPRRLNLCHADLSGLNLSNANLSDANLSTTRLVGTNFVGANLDGARLDGSYIKNSNFDAASLRRASFRTVEITGSLFAYANLERSRFRDTKITDSDFTGADLSHVSFYNVIAIRVNFHFADLSLANLGNMKITDVVFKDALLYLSNLRQLNIGEERRDDIAEFCRTLTSARGWQFSLRKQKFLCGARILPGKYPLDGENLQPK
ncbi:MAG: pentapeptide repeat-containing protein [Alphaproteobacteria bacterium]|nr:pentapeptide repeat-containing protein [Alphaproteobacteria bacterium]